MAQMNQYRQAPSGDVMRQFASLYDSNQGLLNNFYGQQDQKYADTGDSEKRNYNTIMDILNNTAANKSKGFAVRG